MKTFTMRAARFRFYAWRFFPPLRGIHVQVPITTTQQQCRRSRDRVEGNKTTCSFFWGLISDPPDRDQKPNAACRR